MKRRVAKKVMRGRWAGRYSKQQRQHADRVFNRYFVRVTKYLAAKHGGKIVWLDFPQIGTTP